MEKNSTFHPSCKKVSFNSLHSKWTLFKFRSPNGFSLVCFYSAKLCNKTSSLGPCFGSSINYVIIQGEEVLIPNVNAGHLVWDFVDICF